MITYRELAESDLARITEIDQSIFALATEFAREPL